MWIRRQLPALVALWMLIGVLPLQVSARTMLLGNAVIEKVSVLGNDFWITEVSYREGSNIRWATQFCLGSFHFELPYLFSTIASSVGLSLAGVFVMGFASWLLLANRNARRRIAEASAEP